METLLRHLRELPAGKFTVAELEHVNDATLVSAIVALITPPKRAAADSFQLHAPLELLARAALLPHVTPNARAGAREQLVRVGWQYARSGDELPPVVANFPSVRIASEALAHALANADGDTADAALRSLLAAQPLESTLARLRPLLVDHLGAAAHAPILVAELARVADRVVDVGQLLRAPLQSLMRNRAHVRWHRSSVRTSAHRDPARLLRARLGAPPSVQSATTSIAPTILAVEPLADEVLGDVVPSLSHAQATQELLRLAAWAMLDETTEHAPYGWTHCLTLPQAMLHMTRNSPDEKAGVAVAATYVLAFRATLCKVSLDPQRALPHTDDCDALVTRRAAVATAAALHHDAHFAKYTLACFDAAARDPDAAELYLRAAERLAAYWATGP